IYGRGARVDPPFQWLVRRDIRLAGAVLRVLQYSRGVAALAGVTGRTARLQGAGAGLLQYFPITGRLRRRRAGRPACRARQQHERLLGLGGTDRPVVAHGPWHAPADRRARWIIRSLALITHDGVAFGGDAR